MSSQRRTEIALQMSEDVWTIAADGICSRHPDYDDTKVRWALRRFRLGDDVFRRVWPDAPVLAP
jgi:hypothetical protein